MHYKPGMACHYSNVCVWCYQCQNRHQTSSHGDLWRRWKWSDVLCGRHRRTCIPRDEQPHSRYKQRFWPECHRMPRRYTPFEQPGASVHRDRYGIHSEQAWPTHHMSSLSLRDIAYRRGRFPVKRDAQLLYYRPFRWQRYR